MEAGGPKQFFSNLGRIRSEKKKIDHLQKTFTFYKKKSARDSLIELRLAKNCVALDARIAGLLKSLGAHVPEPLSRHYEEIEQELITKVAKPCGLSGVELDRVLFQNYDLIAADLAIRKAMRD
jgi:hypothetical protein